MEDVIEGFYDGKALDRILKLSELQTILLQVTEQQGVANKNNNDAMAAIKKTQDELKVINDDYQDLSSQLAELREGVKIELDAKDLRVVNDTVKETIREFFEDKPEDFVNIHVHFHTDPNEQRHGMSTDATFTVEVDSQFSSLAVQVSKYWGLDYGEIFFLDRDGRVVPDEMKIKDVVIPEEPAKEMISHWQYRVTVVRCGTEISVEDPTAVDESMRDFTFKVEELQEELDEHRKKLNIQVSGTAGEDKLRIPSLLELNRRAASKYRRIRFDQMCRSLELICFVACYFVFAYYTVSPNDPWTNNMRQIKLAVHDRLEVPFASGSRTLSFSEIRQPAEFMQWFETPLREMTMSDGIFEENGIYMLGDVLSRTYTYERPCPPAPAPAGGVVEAEDVNATNSTNSSNGTNGSNVTTTPAPGAAAAPDPFAQLKKEYCTCGDVALQTYNFSGRADIDEPQSQTYTAPKCVPVPAATLTRVLQERFQLGTREHDGFGMFRGKAAIYDEGETHFFPLGNSSGIAWQAAIAAWGNPLEQETVRAVRTSLLLYAAAVNGVLVTSVTVESTTGGLLIPSVDIGIVDLRPMDNNEVFAYAFLISTTLLIFFMELRRWGCPENTVEKETPNMWWVLHMTVPALVVVMFIIRRIMTGAQVGEILHRLIFPATRAELESFQALYRYSSYQFYWVITTLVTLLLLNTLFFRYTIFFFRQNNTLMTAIVRLSHYLGILALLVLTTICCLGVVFYAMFKSVSPRYRTPTMSLMAALSFAFGSFGDHELVSQQYNEAWLIIMILCWFLLTIVFKNLAVAVFCSFLREYMLRENYQYHPYWSQQNPETYNPHEQIKRAW